MEKEVKEMVKLTFNFGKEQKMKNTKTIVWTMLLAAMVVLTTAPAMSSADAVWVNADMDTYVYSGSGGNDNYGAVNNLWVDGAINSLVYFDLSSLSMPTVDSVTLYTYVYYNGTHPATGPLTVTAYRIDESNVWNESEAQWNQRSAGTAWEGGLTGCGTSGTDYYAAEAGSNVFAQGSAAGWHSFTIDKDVIQAWADDSSDNTGLVLIATAYTGTDKLYFRSSEYDGGGTFYGPRLNITYTPEPATMMLLGLGGVGLLIRRRRRA